MMNERSAKFRRVRHRCTSCDAEAALVTGNYLFKESGLSNLVLKNISLIKCDECGNSDPIISDPKALMREMARAIINKPFGLTGEEIRFLRKYLEMGQETFASYLHCDKAVLSRWENDHEPIGSKSDLLIRAIVVIMGEDLKDDREKVVSTFPKIEDGPKEVRWELDPEHLTVAFQV